MPCKTEEMIYRLDPCMDLPNSQPDWHQKISTKMSLNPHGILAR